MKAKDRITAYVCTSASGTCKLPMAVIGAAKVPRCFKLKPPSLPYFSQTNACSDTKTFKQWYYVMFFPYVRTQTSDKVVLLMDNCGPLGTDLVDMTGQVTILTLPPNCTARHQPMDAGVIAAWKTRYKQEMLRRILNNVEHREALRAAAANWKAGTKGTEQGHDPHLSDVCDMALLAWEAISEGKIARCWLKCDILPAGHEADLIARHGKVTHTPKLMNDPDYDMLRTLFNKLKLQIPATDVLAADLEDISDEAIVEWTNVEETDDVREPVVNDLMEFVEESLVQLNVNMERFVQEELIADRMEDETAEENVIPGSQEVIEPFRGVEEMANKSGIGDALLRLQRAKRALLAGNAEQMRSTRRQTLVNEYF